jgi:NADPH:quinone reductase-like Zn-dependent oxidoreductase
MKAAVLHRVGKAPRYEDFPDPVPAQDELVLRVRAVALDNVDKAIARGTHYASRQFLPRLPAVVGSDGIAALQDGRLVGFGGVRPPYGSLAELVPSSNGHFIPIPEGVDAATAAAVPASALTALLPLRWGVRLQPGETVLVNGATGFSGKLAIQVAKLLGAGRVVGSGRNEHALRSLAALGADAVIDLKQSDKGIADAFRREAGSSGYDVVLDFLWGHPTELLLATLVPGELAIVRRRVRLVQIGEAAGPRVSLAADALRTSGVEISGGGAGLTPETMAESSSQVWEWIKAGTLRAAIERVPLKEVKRAWGRTDLHGTKVVIVP